MMESRDYMREPEYRDRPNIWKSATGAILIINIAIFLLQVFLAMATHRQPLASALLGPANTSFDTYFGLSISGLVKGFVWQFLTFQFLHGGLIHLLLNAFGLFMFGNAVESFLGKRRFIWLYIMSGIMGGFVHVVGSLVWPSHFGAMQFGNQIVYQSVVGASAGLFGLIAAFALMNPEHDLTIYLFFVFPVTVAAKVLLGVSIGISVLGVLIDRGNVAHGAHAGGILGGWLMLRFFRSRPVYPASENTDEKFSPSKRKEIETEFLNKEVDAILDKISTKGINSLTPAERKTLDAASRKPDRH
jgi:membrane associated rhomboid family serine protease